MPKKCTQEYIRVFFFSEEYQFYLFSIITIILFLQDIITISYYNWGGNEIT